MPGKKQPCRWHSIRVSPRPNIAIVIRAFAGGGAQRDSVLLANAVHAAGVPVAVHCTSRRGKASINSRSGDPGPHDPAEGASATPCPGCAGCLRALRPKLVMSSESNLNLFCLAAVRLLPRRGGPKLVLREVGSPSVAERYDPYLQNRIAYRLLRAASTATPISSSR